MHRNMWLHSTVSTAIHYNLFDYIGRDMNVGTKQLNLFMWECATPEEAARKAERHFLKVFYIVMSNAAIPVMAGLCREHKSEDFSVIAGRPIYCGNLDLLFNEAMRTVEHCILHGETGKSARYVMDWWKGRDEAWKAENIYRPWNLYIRGFVDFDGDPGKVTGAETQVPPTLPELPRELFRSEFSVSVEAVKGGMSVYRLINEYRKDPDISVMTVRQIAERFSVSPKTVIKFKSWLLAKEGKNPPDVEDDIFVLGDGRCIQQI